MLWPLNVSGTKLEALAKYKTMWGKDQLLQSIFYMFSIRSEQFIDVAGSLHETKGFPSEQARPQIHPEGFAQEVESYVHP